LGLKTKGKGIHGPEETDAQFSARLAHSITDNHGIVTESFLPYDQLNRGRYRFEGYILPMRQDEPKPSELQMPE
jgi:hypothetical protein